MTLKRNTLQPSETKNLAVNINASDGPNSPKIDPGIKMAQAAPALLDYYGVVSTVLGGCCANVWAYEQLLKINPQIGSALTFSQMLFITVQSLPTFLSFPTPFGLPRLKPRVIPLREWCFQVLLLTSGALLNNWAYAYNVPLTVQIVCRSAGLPISMLFGYLFLWKRYSIIQIASVILVSLGVILATISRPSPRLAQETNEKTFAQDARIYAVGITMLIASCILYAFLGLMQERAYRKYGPCWREGVFYTHFLSLPVFLFLIPDIKQGLSSLSTTSSMSPITSYLIMASNLATQFICVSSVNRLTSQVSSVSTNLVLTARKAISLCFSVWYFGNGWNAQLGVGAGMVFVGSLLFTQYPEVQRGDMKDE